MAARSMLLACVVCLSALAGCSSIEESTEVSSALGPSAEPEHYRDAKPEPMPRISPATHLAAGRMLEAQGDPKGAIEQYEKAIAANPRYVAAYNRLGIIYEKLGSSDDAEHILRRGIQADPRAAVLRNNLGYCYLQQRRFQEAEKEFRAALAVSPEFQRARMNRAIALAKLGRKKESLLDFSRVVSADLANYNLAMVCLDMKDYPGAQAALQQAMAINPACPGAEVQLRRVTAVVRAMGLQGDGPDLAKKPTEPIPLAGTADPEGSDPP